MDLAHRCLVQGLIRAHKPNKILELGYGEGVTNSAIREAIEANQFGELTVVDNFFDGKIFETPGLIVDSEEHFVHNTVEKYDMIISDADHNNSHKWNHITMGLLNSPGIAIFHDVTCSMFPNLRNILSEFPQGILFNKNSLPSEKCDRGLYVVFN
jgi:predicted O-methyltransferase YrrM